MDSSRILSELLSEYEQQRLNNRLEEENRRAEAIRRCPELGEMLTAREELIFGAMRGILNHTEQADDIPKKMEVCNRRIAQLLEANGFAADWLDPVYRCRQCRDTGFVGETVREKCACLQKRYYQKLYKAVGLNDPEHQSFESYNDLLLPDAPLEGRPYSQRRLTAAIRTGCEQYADTYPKSKYLDLLLKGSSGLGKTFLLHAAAKRLLERNINVLMLSAVRYFEIARSAYFSGDMTELRPIMEADVLLIDDLGTEPMMNNITIPQWFTLIEERRGAGRGTVWSTNLTEADLIERYTERIASRLLDPHVCAIYTFEGEDLRRRK